MYRFMKYCEISLYKYMKRDYNGITNKRNEEFQNEK